MTKDMKPFRLAGNIYFVGTYKASSHLIDTGDGLILIGHSDLADYRMEIYNADGSRAKMCSRPSASKYPRSPVDRMPWRRTSSVYCGHL